MRLAIDLILLVLALPSIWCIGYLLGDAYKHYDTEYADAHRPLWKTFYNNLCGHWQAR